MLQLWALDECCTSRAANVPSMSLPCCSLSSNAVPDYRDARLVRWLLAVLLTSFVSPLIVVFSSVFWVTGSSSARTHESVGGSLTLTVVLIVE